MNPRCAQSPDFGALVISLDFELHWGVRDNCAPDGPYRGNLLGARQAIPRILDLFEEFEIAATWAAVGFLFAKSRRERERLSPAVRPQYADLRLDPYREPTGAGEDDDPLHYAPGMIEQIRSRPRQEIATHTFSHYYCLEPGETHEAFAADLRSAVAIAHDRGVELRSIVFPRNQFRPGYEELLREFGIVCYRGNEPTWMYRPRPRSRETLAVRAPRLLDHYVSLSGPKVTRWDEIPQPNGLCNVRSSMFLRPFSTRWRSFEPLRLRRIADGLQAAAEQRGIFHLWWHPHNFGAHTEENLQFLRNILQVFFACRRTHGMQSLSMGEVAGLVRNAGDAAGTAEQHAAAGIPVEQVR
ncbi:MAG: polysaccharide deacetylase family protein [Acidobacteria bacterium]|nr:polysaccharide deacetylase family protein [Acidobacteriota bacterium]